MTPFVFHEFFIRLIGPTHEEINAIFNYNKFDYQTHLTESTFFNLFQNDWLIYNNALLITKSANTLQMHPGSVALDSLMGLQGQWRVIGVRNRPIRVGYQYFLLEGRKQV